MSREQNTYLRPAGRAIAVIERSKSRFIGIAERADTVAQARTILHEVRTEYSGASHYVYAFRAGHGNTVYEGMSDDGEPSGTASAPVMAVLRGSGLGDIVVLEVRYFGGTKLGTGGLVHAYSDACKGVLSSLKTELKIELSAFTLTISYALYEDILRTLRGHGATILREEFTEHVTLGIQVPELAVEGLERALADASGGAVNLNPVN